MPLILNIHLIMNACSCTVHATHVPSYMSDLVCWNPGLHIITLNWVVSLLADERSGTMDEYITLPGTHKSHPISKYKNSTLHITYTLLLYSLRLNHPFVPRPSLIFQPRCTSEYKKHGSWSIIIGFVIILKGTRMPQWCYSSHHSKSAPTCPSISHSSWMEPLINTTGGLHQVLNLYLPGKPWIRFSQILIFFYLLWITMYTFCCVSLYKVYANSCW